MNKKATKGYYTKLSNQKLLEKHGALLDIPHCKPSASLYLDILLDEHFAALEKKEAKTKAKPKSGVGRLTTYPDNLNVFAWNKWTEYRAKTKLKKYKTDAKMIELSKMGDQADQMKIVMVSINNEYQGLFPLKANNSAAGKTSGNLSACEDFING